MEVLSSVVIQGEVRFLSLVSFWPSSREGDREGYDLTGAS